MPPPKRMTANPVRPSRHRAGKPTGASSSSESEGSDAEDEVKPQPTKKRTIAPPPRVSGPGKVISTGVAKKPIIDDQARRKEAARKLAEVERKAREDGFVTESEGDSDEEEEEDDDDDEDEESSEEEDSSSEEETRRPVMVRPKFISKAKREAQAQESQSQPGSKTQIQSKSQQQQPEEEEDEQARRRAEADALVEEQIQKDLAARAAGKKHWDDSDGGGSDDVDTTDEADPEAEYAAWRLREIKRIVRARKIIEAREAELAEKERRQNLTEEERRAEDEALLQQQQDDKEARGKMGFLQKYYHKGAFYQDESAAQGLDKRDLMGARFADEVRNRELLPQALQMRDMTKLGKKGATKYRDLKSEDTGQWGRFDDPRRQRSEWDRYGDGDRERDQGGDYGAKGANAMPLGQRKEGGDRDRRDNRERDDRRGGGDSWKKDRPRSRSPRRRDRSRSRSRSPRRGDRDDYRDSRKRDYSRERDRKDDDKRRRVDAR